MSLQLNKSISVRNTVSRRQWTLSKQSGAKFSSNILSRAFDDDRSVGSAKSGKPLIVQLFFQNAAAKVAAPIGEASLTGNYPFCDKAWTF